VIDGLKKVPPVFVVVYERADLSIARLVRPSVRRKGALIAFRAERRPKQPAHEVLTKNDGQHPLEHRNVDPLSFAMALPMEEPRAYRRCQLQAHHAISEDYGCVSRLLAPRAQRKPRNPAHPLDQVIVRRPWTIGTALTEAKCTHVDNARLHLSDFLVGKSEPSHRLRTYVVDE